MKQEYQYLMGYSKGVVRYLLELKPLSTRSLPPGIFSKQHLEVT